MKGVHIISIVNEVIDAIFCQFIFFYKKILSGKKAPNTKQVIFASYGLFVREKIAAFVV